MALLEELQGERAGLKREYRELRCDWTWLRGVCIWRSACYYSQNGCTDHEPFPTTRSQSKALQSLLQRLKASSGFMAGIVDGGDGGGSGKVRRSPPNLPMLKQVW